MFINEEKYKNMYVQDALSLKELNWKIGDKILISGSPSCGKTTFSINYLEFIRDQKKLHSIYLSSRDSAICQINRWFIQKRTYSTLVTGSSIWNDKGQGLYLTGRSCLESYQCIIVDDCHCLLSDAPVIEHIGMLLDYLLYKCTHAIVVFLTSTPRVFTDYVRNNKVQMTAWYDFCLPSPYKNLYHWNHALEIFDLVLKIPIYEKVLLFCSPNKAARWREEFIKRGVDINDIGIIKKTKYIENSNKKETDSTVQQIIKNKLFPQKILFVASASVSYGVSIEDDSVMHIIVDNTDPEFIYHVISRRRIKDNVKTPTLYIRRNSLKRRLRELYIMKEKIKFYREKQFKYFYLDKQQNKSKTNKHSPVPYIPPSAKNKVNSAVEQLTKSNISYYGELSKRNRHDELDLIREVCRLISPLNPISITPLGFYISLSESEKEKIEFINYLETMIGKELFIEHINEIAKKFQKVERRSEPRSDKRALNECFKKMLIPFEFVMSEGFRKKREGAKEKSRYCRLVRTQVEGQ